jgi:Lipocalin-like domain
MKKLVLPVTLFSLTILMLGACKKSSSKSKTEMLTQAGWKINAVGIDANMNGTIDNGESQEQDCQVDNIYTFKTDGTGAVDEGANICSGEQQTSTFNWTFKTNETVINADNDNLNGDFNISSLTDSEFKAYQDIDMGGGTTMRVLVIFKH